MVMTHKTKGKFQPKWEGSYVVETVYSNGAYRLTNPNGDMLMMPINDKYLKKYYPDHVQHYTSDQRNTSHDQVNTTPLSEDSP